MTGEDNPQFVLNEQFAHHHPFHFRFKKEGELKSWSEEPEREKNLYRKKSLVGKR